MLSLQHMALLTTLIFRNVQERYNYKWAVMNFDKELVQYVMWIGACLYHIIDLYL